MDLAKVSVLGSRVLLKAIKEDDKTAGGVFIPDLAKAKPSKGTVIASGPGFRTPTGELIKNSVKTGDTVLFAKQAVTDIKIGNEELLIIEEKDILAIIVE